MIFAWVIVGRGLNAARPDAILVKRRWTDFGLVIKPVLEGDHTGEQYSTNGRTYTLQVFNKQ